MSAATAVLEVEPAAYREAARALGDEVAGCVLSAWVGLQHALDGTYAMAGSDRAGTQWGSSYDAATTAVMSATTDVINANYRLAALLDQSGINYSRAEAASAAESVESSRSRWATVWVSSVGDVEPSVGVGVPAPAGWSLLHHAIGYAWPDGHQNLLHSAAGGWIRAGDEILSVLADVDRAAVALMLQRAPEVGDAITVVNAMRGHLTDLAHVYFAIADSCTSCAGHLDAAHHAIIAELKSFAEATAVIEAAGALLSVVTVGMSEFAAQGGEAAEVARAASVIRSVVEAFAAAASEVGRSVDAIAARVSVIAERVRPILGRHLEEVRVAMVTDRGQIVIGRKLLTPTEPAVVANSTTERAALTHLDDAANLPGFSAARRQVEEKFGHAAAFGVTLPRGRNGFDEFSRVLTNFVQSPETERKMGSYLGESVVLNFNRKSRLVVIQEIDGRFVSGWKMSSKQISYVLKVGRIGGH